MRGVPAFLNFNGGMVTPLFDARTDQDRYFSSCSILENFICSLQGPVIRRGGSRFVATTKNNGVAWLGKFVFNRTQSYILEFGNSYLRFFTNRGQLLSAGTPFEIVAPWSLSQLTTEDMTFALQFVQDGDFLHIFHGEGTVRPKTLTRSGALSWAITDFEFNYGPFKDIDPDNTITITPSALTGSITLTASSPIFNASHVNSLMYFEEFLDVMNVKYWAAQATLVGTNRYYKHNGNTYWTPNTSGTLGYIPPTHLKGELTDGNPNIPWRYLHSGYGIVRITGFTSTTVVSADVIPTGLGVGTTGRLPGNYTVDPPASEAVVAFTRWAFQSISDVEGWPTCGDFYRERLACARNKEVYFSATGEPNDFAAKTGSQVTVLNGFRLSIRQREIEKIRWLIGHRDLVCGTPGFEFVIGPQTRDQVFSANNVNSDPQTRFGSANQQPVVVETAIMMLQAGNRRVRGVNYSYEIDRYTAEDISVLSEHLTRKGLIDYCLQNETDPIIWAATLDQQLRVNNIIEFDSGLVGCTYNKARNVVGWHNHIIGGFNNSARTLPTKVLSCEAISAPSGDRDDVWFIAERFINGETKRYVEYIEDHTLVEKELEDAFYVDSGLTYDGPPATVIGGFEHLINQEIQLFADGGAHANRTVNSLGQVTLEFAASKVHGGLGYRSRLQTMRPDFGAQDGAAQSRMKSSTEICIRFKDTIGGKFGTPTEQNFIPWRDTNAPVGSSIPLFTGDKYVHMPAEWDRSAFIQVIQDQPLPMTVEAVYPRLYTND